MSECIDVVKPENVDAGKNFLFFLFFFFLPIMGFSLFMAFYGDSKGWYNNSRRKLGLPPTGKDYD